ncbi:hypothetical protein NEOLEDRAFT_1033430, partial [Neolentinus lepideus HHB14362 ss-1]
RRLWDLYAHRVVPYQFSQVAWTGTTPTKHYAISHSWTDTMSGEFAQPGIDSPVNEHRWPVPLPRGVTLEAVRNELLNLEVGPGEVGAEYVWLDVVCLRQHGDSRNEKVRLMEWRIDVPMIGRIYSHALRVVRYYNGLGVAFQAFGWNNERHWLRRAWTVQEISTRTIQAGLPLSIANPLDVVCMDDPYNRRPLRDRLRSVMRLEHAIETGFSALQDILLLIQEMRPRQATRPVDKIVALCSLLRLTQIPMYSEDMDLEDVWALHIKYMPIRLQTAFLWLFDRTGLGKYKWRPSWEQLMTGGFAIVKHWKIPDDNFNMQATDDGSVSSPVQVFDGW